VALEETLTFGEDRSRALDAVAQVLAGRGWVNVVPEVVEDAGDLRVNVWGLWRYEGVAVATLTSSPTRRGVAQPLTLGVLHTRGRLGRDRLVELFGGTGLRVTQDHPQRGLLLEVPAGTETAPLLEVMCATTRALLDYTWAGRWRLDRFG
jgi:hypothetical protein